MQRWNDSISPVSTFCRPLVPGLAVEKRNAKMVSCPFRPLSLLLFLFSLSSLPLSFLIFFLLCVFQGFLLQTGLGEFGECHELP